MTSLPAPVVPSAQRVWRPPRRRILIWAGLSFAWTFGIGGLAVAGAAARFPEGLMLVAVLGPMVALALRFGIRIATAKVAIEASTILIAGPLRTWRVPLDTADRFEAGIGPGVTASPNGQPTIWLFRTTGRPLGIWVFNRDGFIWQEKRLAANLKPLADELNAALAAARASASS